MTNPPKSPPYLEQRGEARYFHAAPGDDVYRVYDVHFVGEQLRLVRITSRAATARIFRPAEGSWRIYHFQAGDRHHLSVFTLQSQLANAREYTPPPRAAKSRAR
ncbi:MAG: hypothetical protein WD825_17220 [Gemmatimonadaceae bacterium]